MLPPSSRSAEFATCFISVSCLVYFWTLEMEATYSSETKGDLQRTKWRYIPEGGTLFQPFLKFL
jgi:hypothetical protein